MLPIYTYNSNRTDFSESSWLYEIGATYVMRHYQTKYMILYYNDRYLVCIVPVSLYTLGSRNQIGFRQTISF